MQLSSVMTLVGGIRPCSTNFEASLTLCAMCNFTITTGSLRLRGREQNEGGRGMMEDREEKGTRGGEQVDRE